MTQEPRAADTLTIHVQPRASRTEVAGVHGDAIKVRVKSPPVDGAANAEVIRFLAKRLGVPRDAVRLISGQSGRRKVVAIDGLQRGEARDRLLHEPP